VPTGSQYDDGVGAGRSEERVITVYGISQSRAFRPLWMLEELGLEYELRPVDFATGDTRTPDHLALNPNGHIPVLVDDGTVLWESMAINLYLADKYDGGLALQSVEDRGHALKWSFWVMTEVELSAVELLFNALVLPEPQRDHAAAAAATERLAAPFAVLNDALEGRDYLVADHFSVADLNVASVVGWCALSRYDFSSMPNIERWLEASMARPAARAAQRA